MTNKTNRNIRVFISSTFKDMQIERDYLMKHIFPELQVIANKHNVSVTTIDLRWGISEEQAHDGKVVGICLKEIEKCIPFFIGIIGDQYGWCPQVGDIKDDSLVRFPSLQQYLHDHLSLTEIEILFGVIDRSEEVNAYFYLKEPFAPDKNEKGTTDDGIRVQNLRERIIDNSCKTKYNYLVSTYSNKYNLGEQVKTDFEKLINRIFPVTFISEYELQFFSIVSYKNLLCQNYIPSKKNFQKLDSWLENKNLSQLIIYGQSGIGKSSFIANWIDNIEAKHSFIVIYIFIGDSIFQGNADIVCDYLSHAIIDKFRLSVPQENLKHSAKDRFKFVYEQAINSQKQAVIILDAINQIDSERDKQLLWLPFPSNNIKLICSTLKTDLTFGVLSNRKPSFLEVTPMCNHDKEAFINNYLSRYSKYFDTKFLPQILSHKLYNNPLVLKSFLNELINFGIFENVGRFIISYLKPKTVNTFFRLLLNNYEEEYGNDSVKIALSVIVLSEQGAPENLIIRIFENQGILPLVWNQIFCSFYNYFHVHNGRISFAHQIIAEAIKKKYICGNVEWEMTIRNLIIDNCGATTGNFKLTELPFQLYKSNRLVDLFKNLVNPTNFLYLYDNDIINLVSYFSYLFQKGYSYKKYLNTVFNMPENLCFEQILKYYEFGYRELDQVLAISGLLKRLKEAVSNEKENLQLLYIQCLNASYLSHNRTALKFCKQYIKLSSLEEENNYYNIIEIYKILCRLLEYYYEYSAAIKALEKAENIIINYLGTNSIYLYNVYDSLSYCYSSFCPEWVSILNHKKDYYETQRDLYKNKAKRILRTVVREINAESSTKLPSYSNIEKLRDLSRFLCDCNDNKNALPLIKKEIKLLHYFYQIDSPELHDAFRRLSECYEWLHFSTGRTEDEIKAIYYSNKAIDVCRKIYGEKSEQYIYDLGHSTHFISNPTEVINIYKQIVECASSFYGASHHQTLHYKVSLGIEMTRAEEFRNAISLFEEVIEMMKGKTYRDPECYSVTLNNTVKIWRAIAINRKYIKDIIPTLLKESKDLINKERKSTCEMSPKGAPHFYFENKYKCGYKVLSPSCDKDIYVSQITITLYNKLRSEYKTSQLKEYIINLDYSLDADRWPLADLAGSGICLSSGGLDKIESFLSEGKQFAEIIKGCFNKAFDKFFFGERE